MSDKKQSFSISHDSPEEFEWDEDKNLKNIEAHGVDFVRAKEIWTGEVIEVPSGQQHHGEMRHLAIGTVGDDERLITVVFTYRCEIRRIISARRARDNERKNYQNAFRRGS